MLKMIKMPKQPKKTASVAVKERYLDRLAKVRKENKVRQAYNKKLVELDKKIVKAVAGFGK